MRLGSSQQKGSLIWRCPLSVDSQTIVCTMLVMARVTSRDVGRLAGVHPSTVSRVLNRSFSQHSYDPQTVERIERCARQLGYRPSHAARSLRMGRTMLMGVVVSDIANPFFGEIAALIERFARQEGYRTFICNTQDDPALQAEHLEDLAARQVDGIILSPSGIAGCDRVIQAGLPLVAIDRALGPLPQQKETVPFVGLDSMLAGRLLGEHLQRLRKQRIGVVMPASEHDPTLEHRLSGLREGLGSSGQILWTESGTSQWLLRAGRKQLAERLAAASAPLDAVVGLTNQATLMAIQAVGDLGWTPGHPVGIAGIDDFSAADILRPGITVVAQPVEEIARTATRLLVACMKQEGKRPAPRAAPPISREPIYLPPRLVARGSLGEAAEQQHSSP